MVTFVDTFIRRNVFSAGIGSLIEREHMSKDLNNHLVFTI